ncbi:MAG: trypsin-like peptidase domain-containing protein [Ignavibacteria bacterium]|nr:trypsin-like peptidase domain-containing protein [Ignavibacteria bacterium]MBK7158627.1 trypsin-like peptidase domain-containing protein [Ignavibacteria bacterium]MBK9405756.1 trypsin-like peptidase domain-containing protein [Ignavibacteria bacterium]
MNKKFFIGLAVLLTLISGIVIGKYFLSGNKNVSPVSGVAPVKNEIQENSKNISETRENAITRAVKKVSPTIVGINVEEVREVQDPFSMFDNDPFFKQFFGNRPAQKQVVKGLGSGFIISSDGYILTNDHVAGNATKISVTMTNGETIEAKLIGSDKNSDVALLKINKSNLEYVKLGNSDDVIIGEWVIALGNPFGLFEINDKPTVTVGVVSATNMKVNADGNRVYKDMIQTDASINAGNSGGPLVNAEGDVIGMNTIIFTGGNYSTGSIGVGFSISINRVKKIFEEIKSNGKIERNFNVGFRIQGIDERIAKYLKLDKAQGVVVTDVQKGSLSDNAGLKPEDVIIMANGENIRNEQDLLFIVNDMRTGETLKLKIIRNGSEKELEMKLTSG